tara:strand:+ start:721 stop:1494 length:774 start_codon:yes stop_codon:yes gene_type:complete
MRSDFFSRKNTHSVALGKGCTRLFGLEWLHWEQKTTREELELHGFSTNELTLSKIAAYKTMATTISPWADWEIFEKIGHAINNSVPSFDLRQPLTVAEIVATVDAMRMTRVITFTEPVKRYIAACAATEEFLYLPDPITFSMPFLCPEMYSCNECGTTEINDLVDGRCDLCSGRYEDGELKDRPLEGLENRGTDIQYFSKYEYAPIANKYEALKTLDLNMVRLDLNMVDMQVSKLLDVNEYRKKRMSEYNLDLQELA